MTLEQIFVKNPELIEHEEVIKLVEYVTENHNKLRALFETKKVFYDKIVDEVLKSEVVLINGKKSENVIRELYKLI